MKSKKSLNKLGYKKAPTKKKSSNKENSSNEIKMSPGKDSHCHDLVQNTPFAEDKKEKCQQEFDLNECQSPAHSMISSASWIRERELETSNENLQETLKDTEERLQSLRIQYESLSQVHRTLRENHTTLQEETDKLKIDFQILTECGNALR
jgi:hypothetical protein